MYADNDYTRMMSVSIFALFILSVSITFNIKQFFDVAYYKGIATETEGLLKSMVPTMAQITKLSPLRTRTVSASEAKCMAENIYFEAATESLIGKIAVGQVVLNRLKKPNYPKTVCGVVNQKVGSVCMFSWTCYDRKEIRNPQAWKQSQQVAYDLLSKDPTQMVDITEGATHFHGIQVKPGWNNLKPTAKIDNHQFYR